MKWSLRIGSLLGIPIYVHATFPLLLAWVGVSAWLPERDLGQALAGIVFVLAIFVCVVLHELGHALAARRFGIHTRDVTLLPIGGVARLERMPEQPLQELWVALAGPAVNVAIAAVLAVWVGLRGALGGLEQVTATSGAFAMRLLAINVLLVVFNLLPAFPMDGGRVLRALLATRLEYPRATRIAAQVGQGFALLFGVLGIFGNPFLLLIALFVWIGAGQEATQVRVRAAISGVSVERVMLTDFETLAPNDRLERAARLTLEGSQKDFPVVENGRVVGLLQQGDLLSGLNQSGEDAPVSEFMRRQYPQVELSDAVETVFARFQESAFRTLPVTRQGRIVGLATLENIGEFLAIRSALSDASKARGAG